MGGLSGAASVIAVIDLSTKITALCFHYSAAVKNAKKDIEHLERKVSDIKDVFGQVRQLLDGQDRTMPSAITACRYIGDKKDNPKTHLEIFLQYQKANQFSSLDKTYLPILNQLFDDEDELDKDRRTNKFRKVVGSIVVLKSPLSIVEQFTAKSMMVMASC